MMIMRDDDFDTKLWFVNFKNLLNYFKKFISFLTLSKLSATILKARWWFASIIFRILDKNLNVQKPRSWLLD